MGEKRCALVTGSSRGIGAATVRALVGDGYVVGINYYRSKERAEKLLAEVEAHGGEGMLLAFDVADTAAARTGIDAFVGCYGRLDLFVNNAGITLLAPFLETSEELFDRTLGTDLRGSFFAAQCAARHMVRLGRPGVIVNIGSNHQAACWPGATAYAASKAALAKLTENMAMELGGYGIRVVNVAPGYTWTDSYDEAPTERTDRIASRIPLGRIAKTDDVANMVRFAASDNAAYLTGTTILLDGGAVLPVVVENDYT